jgi:hypothetical protein
LGPHLPQFLYFSAAARRSCLVSLRAGIELPFSAMNGENGEMIEICFWDLGIGNLISSLPERVVNLLKDPDALTNDDGMAPD